MLRRLSEFSISILGRVLVAPVLVAPVLVAPVLVGLVLSLSACELATNTPVSTYKPSNLIYTMPGFEQRAPSVVGVLPITGGAIPKVETATKLRDSLYWQLMEKRYAPLANEYVDSQMRHQGLGPADDAVKFREVLPCDAVLKANINFLDLQTYRDSGRAIVRGELTFNEVRSGSVLWSMSHEYIVKPSMRQGTLKPDQDFDEACLDQFLTKCLELLPERPDPGQPAK